MGRNLYIADTHFGHKNIIRFDSRPFATVDEMEEEMVKRWNVAVEPSDTVYILGDFCWGKEDEWLRILNMLKGSKVLILGNHDLKNMSSQLRNKFQDVKDKKEITDGGRHVIMSHYPELLYKGLIIPVAICFAVMSMLPARMISWSAGQRSCGRVGENPVIASATLSM